VACLSWKPDGTKGFTVAANPIFLLSDPTTPVVGSIEFEILARDAELLKEHVGIVQYFYIDERTGVFAAKLSPLVPVTSTHPGLEYMRNTPTLRGRLQVIPDQGAAQTQ
jgi:hypothetical protein